jgi:hypothetical protein
MGALDVDYENLILSSVTFGVTILNSDLFA